MSKIPEEVIDRLLSQNDIVDVVREHVQLTKKGRNFFGLCPFHGENTPSFSVSQDKQIFHCFGCGKGGNALKFLMEIESIPFVEAVQVLAQKSGEELSLEWSTPAKDETLSKEQEDLLQAYEWSAKLFHHVLKHTRDGNEAMNYIKKRGFSDETIEQFQLGFSPTKKAFLSAFLEGKGFDLELLRNAGLIEARQPNEYYDRFQGRLIFPIHNHQGKIIAFGGRAIHEGQTPKYLNSPESKLFQKSRLLYNFYQARKHFRKTNEAILFEGYNDVIKAHQAGIEHSVATLGTSLTSSHANILKRYVDQVIICFDGDEAGQQASFKAANTLNKAGVKVRVAYIPDQMDPDEYIDRYGEEYFRKKILEPALVYTAFLLEYHKKEYNLSLDHERIAYIEKALDIIAATEQAVARDHYLGELEKSFQLNRDTLVESLEKRITRIKQTSNVHDKHAKIFRVRGQKQPQEKLYTAYQNAERHLIALMLKDRDIAMRCQKRLGAAFNVQEHQVIVTYLYGYYEEEDEVTISHFVERIPEEYRQLVIEISLLDINESIDEEALEDYFLAIEKESDIDQEIRALATMLKQAEKENDAKSAARIGMKMIELRKKRNKSKLS